MKYFTWNSLCNNINWILFQCNIKLQTETKDHIKYKCSMTEMIYCPSFSEWLDKSAKVELDIFKIFMNKSWIRIQLRHMILEKLNILEMWRGYISDNNFDITRARGMFYQIFIQISYYNLLLWDIFQFLLQVIQIFDIFGLLASCVCHWWWMAGWNR